MVLVFQLGRESLPPPLPIRLRRIKVPEIFQNRVRNREGDRVQILHPNVLAVIPVPLEPKVARLGELAAILAVLLEGDHAHKYLVFHEVAVHVSFEGDEELESPVLRAPRVTALPALKLQVGLLNAAHHVELRCVPQVHVFGYEELRKLLLTHPLDLNKPAHIEGYAPMPIHIVLYLLDVGVYGAGGGVQGLLEPVSNLKHIPLLHLLVVLVHIFVRVLLTHEFQVLPFENLLIRQIRRHDRTKIILRHRHQ